MSRLISWHTLLIPKAEVITLGEDTRKANGPARAGSGGCDGQIYHSTLFKSRSPALEVALLSSAAQRLS